MSVLRNLACPPPVEKVPDEENEEAEKPAQGKPVEKEKVRKDKIKAVLGKVSKEFDTDRKPDGGYEAGTFLGLYRDFVRDARAKGATQREANNLWKQSSTRARMLSGLSESERKKRRFN